MKAHPSVRPCIWCLLSPHPARPKRKAAFPTLAAPSFKRWLWDPECREEKSCPLLLFLPPCKQTTPKSVHVFQWDTWGWVYKPPRQPLILTPTTVEKRESKDGNLRPAISCVAAATESFWRIICSTTYSTRNKSSKSRVTWMGTLVQASWKRFQVLKSPVYSYFQMLLTAFSGHNKLRAI